MVNSILTAINGLMTQLKVPTQLGQGIISAVEFFLTGGQMIIDLFKKAFSFIS